MSLDSTYVSRKQQPFKLDVCYPNLLKRYSIVYSMRLAGKKDMRFITQLSVDSNS